MNKEKQTNDKFTKVLQAKKNIKISGGKIFLRVLTEKDVTQTYVGWLNDKSINQFLESRWVKHTIRGIKDYVRSMHDSPYNFLFGIFLKENNRHIGNIKIGNINRMNKFADLGLLIGDKTVWGKGYGTQAIKLATQYAFENLKLNKLIAGINELNAGSYKAFIKAGYEEVGIFKKHAFYKGNFVNSILVEKCNSDSMANKKQEAIKSSGSGINLWDRAKKIIPGGNQLLSKRAEMFLPEQWPAYFKKAKGIYVWDLDGNKYIDMSIMGIGSCVLGYANDAVDAAVKIAIEQGTMCTLNCSEEVELAEKLIKLHPWAGMVRFGRAGGEACAIAVRIGRAFSGKDKIAFCGYHGWHDWYLSANLADSKNLDGQLLPGLSCAGVPRALKGTPMPFNYGKIDELREIIGKNKGEIGVIIMEVERHKKIDLKFLKEVRGIASDTGVVLIFDEVSSGFRVNVGGVHALYDIEPDIVVLGKALGNGYPISAVVGKKDVMQAAQDTFISSTFWTERIGFVAALETVKQFEKNNVISYVKDAGNR
ncbi:MAG TPA: aminotransferase class III-fold pyridoxal phosphate-dependent enzyme, partial [Candidatus Omnitrophica bacterium]|nr:aminotransferase class III-fold pyridoxal phosphate-dependent enzyme [Candidatus Omnitrophota bacterium]